MPCSAIQNESVRNGCMFRCAWLPPTFVMEPGFKLVSAVGVEYPLLNEARNAPFGLFVPPFAEEALSTCV